MKLINSLGVILVALTLVGLHSGAQVGNGLSPDSDSWLRRREKFYADTSFRLTEDQLRLYGGRLAPYRLQHEPVHLPFWFDFELFKSVFNKHYSSPEEELERANTYVTSCLKTLRSRVLYRILAGTRDSQITANADALFNERLAAHLGPQWGAGAGPANEAASTAAAAAPNSSHVEGAKLAFLVELEHSPIEGHATGLLARPIEKALHLVRAELDQVESRNQMNHYLMELNEETGPAMAGKLPY